MLYIPLMCIQQFKELTFNIHCKSELTDCGQSEDVYLYKGMIEKKSYFLFFPHCFENIYMIEEKPRAQETAASKPLK